MTYDELREKAIEHGGVLTVNMGTLRDIHEAKKLGSTVRENITKELRSRGLTHAWEHELPAYQHERVRIWLMGSPASDLIEAVYNESEDADKAIRQAVESDAADVLQQVRELVCA
jgi:hypothetical protein